MSEPTVRKTVSYVVPAISCASCVIRINALLRQQRGISGVQIDLATKTLQFTYRPEQVTLAPLMDTLAAAGYPATTLDNSSR